MARISSRFNKNSAPSQLNLSVAHSNFSYTGNFTELCFVPIQIIYVFVVFIFKSE